MTLTCEVCETSQPAARRCSACGLPLRLPPGIRPPPEPVAAPPPGFEPTVEEASAPARIEPLPGFEATGFAPANAPELDPFDDWEPNSELELLLDDEDPPPPPGLEITSFEPARDFRGVHEEVAFTRCRACGGRVPLRPACAECGQPLASSAS